MTFIRLLFSTPLVQRQSLAFGLRTTHVSVRSSPLSTLDLLSLTLSGVILCFSGAPKTPCDFLSMTYDIPSRAATILVRQSWEPRRHNLDDLDEYDHRLESCRAHWAHPLIMPVVLLQVQLMRCEEAVSDNNSNVSSLELDVSNIAGFEGFEGFDTASRRLQRQLSHSKDGTKTGQSWGPLNMTNLMKKAHEVLKDSVKLLDTIRWMERAVKLLILCGDELAERMGSTPPQFSSDFYVPSPKFGEFEREPSPYLTVPSPRVVRPVPEYASDHLVSHWHEIRQYLDGLLRLCMGLETDRRMSEARCRAQIDIVSQDALSARHSTDKVRSTVRWPKKTTC